MGASAFSFQMVDLLSESSALTGVVVWVSAVWRAMAATVKAPAVALLLTMTTRLGDRHAWLTGQCDVNAVVNNNLYLS